MSYADMPTGPSSGSNKTLMLALLALIVIVASLRWFGGEDESAPGVGGGDSGGATGRLLVLNGRASLLRDDGPPVPDVLAGETAVVEIGDRIRTAEGATARLTFGSASTVEVGADAEVAMLDLRTGLLSRGPVISLALLRGEVRVRLEDMPLRTGEVLLETSVLTLASRASQLECSMTGADRAHVAVHTGEATVSMGEQSVRVAAGQILDAALGQTLSPITVATLAGPATATASSGVPSFLDESNQTLFPPIVTPTRPGDPAPAGTPPPAAIAGGDTYVVQAGDTLYSIARRSGVSWEALWEANRDEVPSPELIREGQTLRIPR